MEGVQENHHGEPEGSRGGGAEWPSHRRPRRVVRVPISRVNTARGTRKIEAPLGMVLGKKESEGRRPSL